MVRVVFLDRAGRPRLIAETFLHQEGAEMSVRVLDRQGAVRLTATLLVHRRGMVGVAVAVLDRHGTPRLLFARFLRVDGSAEVRINVVFVTRTRARRGGLFPALGHRHLHRQGEAVLAVAQPRVFLARFLRVDGLAEVRINVVFVTRRPMRQGGLFPALGQRHLRRQEALLSVAQPRLHNVRGLPRLQRQAAALALARPRSDAYNVRGLHRLHPEAAALALALARPRSDAYNGPRLHRLHPQAAVAPRGFGVLPATALGLASPHGDGADLARGLFDAWSRMIVATGLDHQARPPRLFPAAALVVDGAHSALPPAAAPHWMPRLPLLAAAADVLNRRRIPLAVAALDPPPRPLATALGPPPRPPAASLGTPARPLAASLGPPARPLVTALGSPPDDNLLRRLEEGLRQRGEGPQSVTSLLAGFFALSEVEQMHFINELANQAPEMALRLDRLNLTLTPSNQPEARRPEGNIKRRMWRSFLATVGLSVVSNILLYLLHVGNNMLEKNEQGASSPCTESPNAETPRVEGSRWVTKFIAWLVDRFIAPVFLTSLLLLVNLSVIDKERHMMSYEYNVIANILINGLSRGFFLGIRSYPGVKNPELCARLASVLIEILGAAFVWWMGGNWDPDIADG